LYYYSKKKKARECTSGHAQNILYIRNELKAKELTIEGNFKESIWIKIKLNGKDRMLIACMYKSSSSEESNLKCLNEMIMQASSISARTKSYLRRCYL
jgi:hypothetical protein